MIVAVGLLPASLLLLTYNISVCHILGWVGIGVLGLSVVLMVCALIVNAARGYKDVCNRNVVVEDGEIKYSSGKNSDKKIRRKRAKSRRLRRVLSHSIFRKLCLGRRLYLSKKFALQRHHGRF